MAHYKRAVDLYTALGSAQNWKSIARLRNNLAMVMRELDLGPQAETCYLQALESYDQAPQKEYAGEISDLLGNLAFLHFDRGLYDEAIFVQRRALDVAKMHLSQDHAGMCKRERRAGIFAYFAGDADQALAHLTRARELLLDINAARTDAHVELLVNLAAVHVEKKDFGGALKLSETAAELLSDMKGSDDLFLSAVLNNIGCHRLRLRDNQGALEALTWSLGILKDHPAADEVARAEVCHNLALTYELLGSKVAAASYRRFSTEMFSNLSEDCRQKLTIAAASGEAVASTAARPDAMAEQAFVRLPVQISLMKTQGKFAVPMKTETIEWDM